MKKVAYFILIAIISFTYTCKKESENYSFYRPSHPQNFKTIIGGELYAYTANDSTVERADYYLKVQGKIKTYGSAIAKYGHCWSTSPNPTIGTNNFKDYEGPALAFGGIDTTTYITGIASLTPNTIYYVRSYVKVAIGPGDTLYGYNPIVSEILTLPAIDEWFELSGSKKPLNGTRFDAIAANFGDSLFFGTGNTGQSSIYKDLYWYDPSLMTWDVFPTDLPVKITDAVAFAVEFEDKVAQQGKKARCLYIGLGDLVGSGNPDDKTNLIFEYDFDRKSWATKIFSGIKRTGAVAFVIGDKVYLGTGQAAAYLNDWWVYTPAYDRDGDPETFPWRGMATKPSEVGRSGAIAFSMNGRGYFGLGRNEAGEFLNDFYEFRPNDKPGQEVNGTWIKKADFPGTERANAVAFVIGNQAYVGSGDNSTDDMEAAGGISSGKIFNDFYRYDPFNDRWDIIQIYTANKTLRIDAIRPITRAVGLASQKEKLGFVGYGIIPDNYPVPNQPNDSTTFRAQKDFWKYQPYAPGKK